MFARPPLQDNSSFNLFVSSLNTFDLNTGASERRQLYELVILERLAFNKQLILHGGICVIESITQVLCYYCGF